MDSSSDTLQGSANESAMMRTIHHSKTDTGRPWDDWHCLYSDEDHWVKWICENPAEYGRCRLCGLSISKGENGVSVKGYLRYGDCLPDLEAARKLVDAEVTRMLRETKTDIDKLCLQVGVSQLDIFGSVASGLSNSRSDMDFLVRFDDFENNMFRRYFDLKNGLERIFGREVDLVIESDIKNPYFKESVELSRRKVCAS